MARGRKKSDASLEDEKHPLDAEGSEESEVALESEEAAVEEIPAVAEEPKKISGSPLGKVRGKDLKFHK